jgi:hypothetical protein
MQFSPDSSVTASFIGPNIIIINLFSNTLNLCSFLNDVCVCVCVCEPGRSGSIVSGYGLDD